jgi:hypothetical protein
MRSRCKDLPCPKCAMPAWPDKVLGWPRAKVTAAAPAGELLLGRSPQVADDLIRNGPAVHRLIVAPAFMRYLSFRMISSADLAGALAKASSAQSLS